MSDSEASKMWKCKRFVHVEMAPAMRGVMSDNFTLILESFDSSIFHLELPAFLSITSVTRSIDWRATQSISLSAGHLQTKNSFARCFGEGNIQEIIHYSSSQTRTHLPVSPKIKKKTDQTISKGEQHFLACSATCLCALRCFSWTRHSFSSFQLSLFFLEGGNFL